MREVWWFLCYINLQSKDDNFGLQLQQVRNVRTITASHTQCSAVPPSAPRTSGTKQESNTVRLEQFLVWSRETEEEVWSDASSRCSIVWSLGAFRMFVLYLNTMIYLLKAFVGSVSSRPVLSLILINPSSLLRSYLSNGWFRPVFWFHDIGLDPDPRIHASESGSIRSGSCCFHHWPSRRLQKTNLLKQIFPLITFWRYIYIILQT